MHVLMTADTVGGVWTYALELAQALRAHDVAVTLATMGAPLNAMQRAAVQHMPWLQVCESSYRLEWMDEPWDDVALAGGWLLDLERQIAPDLVHLNGYVHAALPWHAPTLVVGHSCVLSWWEAVHGEPAPAWWKRYRDAVTQGLQQADMVLAPTAAMLTDLERLYGPFARTAVVPNGRAASAFPPHAKEPFVLAAGRLWDEAKNIAALDAVADRLPWPVFVAGANQHPDGGTATAANVRMLGSLAPDALAQWMGRAAMYALPARYEPFGLSVLEAALAGCALVLGDIASLRELWHDAALFVPPNDHAALHAALTRLMDDEQQRTALAAHARARAVQFTPERMAAEYLAAYKSLVKPVRSRAHDVWD
jgi:glycosyltransferase involved in cell wall biosynthesis